MIMLRMPDLVEVSRKEAWVSQPLESLHIASLSSEYVGGDTDKIKDASALGTLAWTPLYHKDYAKRSDFQLSTADMKDTWLLPGVTYNFSQVFIDSTIQMLGSLLASGDSVYGRNYQTDVLKPLYLSKKSHADV